VLVDFFPDVARADAARVVRRHGGQIEPNPFLVGPLAQPLTSGHIPGLISAGQLASGPHLR
jgi:hypothetical protein